MTALAVAAALVTVFGLLHLELNLFSPAPRGGLRVLMYHRVGAHPARDTVSAEALDRQLGWLRAQGASFVGFSDLVAHRRRGLPLPERPVLVTFDDGTADHLEAALPVLRRHGVRAGLFVVPAFVGRELEYGGRQRFLDAGELRTLAAAGLEIGLHSFDHLDLSKLPPAGVEDQMARSFAFFAGQGIPVQPVLAYPFGAYPRTGPMQPLFFAALRRGGVALAFRIGNRVNPLPLATDYEIERIGIRRGDALWSFAIKFRKGRRKAFA